MKLINLVKRISFAALGLSAMFLASCKPEEEIDKYHNPLNKIICEETIRLGGSMVHHHGIGKHRVHWSKLEHGSAWALLEGLKKQFDPNGIMNTGTIYPIEK